MTTKAERWRRVRALFDHAAELEGAERDVYLEGACAEDEALHAEVLALLDADRAASGALDAAVASATEALSEAADALPERIGPYRVLGELGRGGMGVVFRATRDDGSYQQDVAIKVIPHHLGSTEARRRFRTERQILADLDHPAIARLLDGGTTGDGLPYLVMEHVDGEPIDVYCRRTDLDLDGRLALVVQVCDAVSHAHARLVVHRDLKPANILIAENGRPKLLDFGIAKMLDNETAEATTRTGLLPMTPEYASPEQVGGGAVTVATDVYSLGVLLYELLSGASPYGAAGRGTPAQLARAIAEIEPARPSVAARRSAADDPRSPPVPARQLEGDLDAIVGAALRKDLKRRYTSVEQLATDLRHFLRGQPVTAVADSWHYRAGKWLRRNVLTATLAALALVALLGGLAARTVEARRAEREAARANAEAARASREAEITNQVSHFLESLFTATTPSEARGREVTARELLDRGVERIESELAEQPVVQARLLHAMGEAYRRIGRFESAEDLLERALAQRQAQADVAATDIASSHMSLGDLFKETQRPNEAEKHWRAAIAIHERLTDPEDPGLIRALQSLGTILNRQMKLDEAEAVLLRATALMDAMPEPDPELGASLAVKLGSLYADRGKPEQALAAMQRALVISRAHYGTDHVRSLVVLNNVGQALVELGRPTEAEERLAEALPIARRLLEPSHPLLATVVRNLGTSLARQGRLDEAEPLLNEALANHVANFGEAQFLTQLVSAGLGLVRLRQGRLDEADERLARALAIIEPVFGAEHLVVGELLHFQGELRSQQGHRDEAKALFERALAIREPIFGTDGPLTRETREALDRLHAPTSP